MSAPALHLDVFDPAQAADWDTQVRRFPDARFFHTRAWQQVLAETYGLRTCCIRATRADGSPAALLPFAEVDSWITGRRGVSLPFADDCPPLADDPAALHAALGAVTAHARARRWKYWELRGNPGLAAPAATSFHSHQLALQPDTARLFARCDSAARRSVRKAEQAGLTLTFHHDLEATCRFHALLCLTRRRHGVPPQPFRFFAQIQRHILAPRHGCIVLAAHAGVPVAGAMFFHFGRHALFKFGASDVRWQHLRPNNLVLWRAIEWHARAGFTQLDFGRTSLGNEGLRRFKLGWGATERRLDYARFDCRTAAFVPAGDRSSGWSHGLIKHLPLAVGRLLGAAAYRHVA